VSIETPRENLSTGFKWSYGDHNFIGFSIAGITTSLVYENASIAMDVGQGLPFNIPRNHYFLTHCHSDHAGGLAYVLSQRSLWSLPPAHVYTLPQYTQPLTQIVEAWNKLEDFTYPFHMRGMNVGDAVDIDKDFSVTSFKTIHRVPSQGYIVSKKKKKLKEQFKKLKQEDLLKHIKNGEDVNEVSSHNIFAFTGDTQIEFLDTFKEPVDVLFMETTFIDNLRTVDAARQWGHIHLDEWKHRIEQIPAKKIVLIHLSSRYGTARALEVLDNEIQKEFRGKVELFPRPF
jgi:ribonuclease Z